MYSISTIPGQIDTRKVKEDQFSVSIVLDKGQQHAIHLLCKLMNNVHKLCTTHNLRRILSL